MNKIEILVVEDSPIQAEELRHMLENHGYYVSVAYNGAKALTAMREHKPALIISDIVMPVMDGYELCRQVKEDEDLKDIPIILLTFLSDPADVIKSLEYGAHIFVTKPYSEHSLLARIQDVITDKGLPRVNDVEGGVEIFFAGQKHVVTSDRKQILALLLATFDNAVQKSRELDQANKELVKTQLKLKTFNKELERRVEERTVELVETNAALRREIARREQAEEQIKAALEEKGVLLREVQHRVRNNLQSLIYLMDMQAEKIEAPEALLALGALQGRARTMALVHENLLNVQDLARIDFGDYLEDLVIYLLQAWGEGRDIAMRVDAEEIFLDVNIATPCGLIANELVSNALKHAFPASPALRASPPPGGTEGGSEIRVAFGVQEGEYVLTVSDNGVGLPPELDWRAPESLGLRLVQLWAAHQMRGTIEVDTPACPERGHSVPSRRNGTAFTIRFPKRSA